MPQSKADMECVYQYRARHSMAQAKAEREGAKEKHYHRGIELTTQVDPLARLMKSSEWAVVKRAMSDVEAGEKFLHSGEELVRFDLKLKPGEYVGELVPDPRKGMWAFFAGPCKLKLAYKHIFNYVCPGNVLINEVLFPSDKGYK